MKIFCLWTDFSHTLHKPFLGTYQVHIQSYKNCCTTCQEIRWQDTDGHSFIIIRIKPSLSLFAPKRVSRVPSVDISWVYFSLIRTLIQYNNLYTYPFNWDRYLLLGVVLLIVIRTLHVIANVQNEPCCFILRVQFLPYFLTRLLILKPVCSQIKTMTWLYFSSSRCRGKFSLFIFCVTFKIIEQKKIFSD